MATQGTEKNNPLIEKLFSVGAHFGYTRARRHPSITPFIFGVKNRVELFDLERTSALLEAAKRAAYELGQHKKTLLFVSGKHEARAVLQSAAESASSPYVAGRWIGGTLTNFDEIKKRLERLEELTSRREKGELEKKYTKREILDIDREIEDLERQFGGIRAMRKLPDALFIVDTKHESSAVREARQLNIPIIGLMNSDGNAREITYPIIGNDSALASISFFVSEVADAYKDGVANPVASTAKDIEDGKEDGKGAQNGENESKE